MRPFRSIALITPVVLVSSLVALAKADAPPARTVTTTGEAIVYATPDEVIVNVGVESFDADLDKAKVGNAKLAASLIKAIKALGVEDKWIQTDNLQVEVQYIANHPWEGVRGYIARRGYSITLKETKLFEKLIDTSLKNGGNQINGFEFRTTELRKYRDQARSMAIKAAKEKAVALAKDLECGVGRPWQISEGSNGYWGNRNFMGNAQNNAIAAAPGGGDESETLPPGQVAIRADVSVVFDLTEK